MCFFVCCWCNSQCISSVQFPFGELERTDSNIWCIQLLFALLVFVYLHGYACRSFFRTSLFFFFLLFFPCFISYLALFVCILEVSNASSFLFTHFDSIHLLYSHTYLAKICLATLYEIRTTWSADSSRQKKNILSYESIEFHIASATVLFLCV